MPSVRQVTSFGGLDSRIIRSNRILGYLFQTSLRMVRSRAINTNSQAKNEPSGHLSAPALNVLVEPSSVIFALNFPTTFKSLRSLCKVFIQCCSSACYSANIYAICARPSLSTTAHPLPQPKHRPSPIGGLSPALSSFPPQFPHASPVGPLPLAESRWIVWKELRNVGAARVA